MGKVTIYLPDDLEEVAKHSLGNVSIICRAAIENEVEIVTGNKRNRDRNIAMQLRLLAERLVESPK